MAEDKSRVPELVHRFTARRLDREVTWVLRVAPEIAFSDELESTPNVGYQSINRGRPPPSIFQASLSKTTRHTTGLERRFLAFGLSAGSSGRMRDGRAP